jgi:hypothetical protein
MLVAHSCRKFRCIDMQILHYMHTLMQQEKWSILLLCAPDVATAGIQGG